MSAPKMPLPHSTVSASCPDLVRSRRFPLAASKATGLKALLFGIAGLGLLGLSGCGINTSGGSGEINTAQAADSDAIGQLEIRANGEDFVRDGFVSKDGWAIGFDNLYLGLADVVALQTDPPFDPDSEQAPQIVTQAAAQSDVTVVDLASDDAPTALVAEFPQAKAGRYNALSWRVVPATTGPSSGQSLRLVGQASKDGTTVPFTLDWDQSYSYVCGDFIGDQRKGILKAGDRSDLEATFHFDHVFGDGDAPQDDYLNQKALGFEPLAELAEAGELTVNRDQLEAQLSPEDFQQLETAIAGLAHVGEGHCRPGAIASSAGAAQ